MLALLVKAVSTKLSPQFLTKLLHLDSHTLTAQVSFHEVSFPVTDVYFTHHEMIISLGSRFLNILVH